MKNALLLLLFISSTGAMLAQTTRVEVPVEFYRNQLRDGELPPDLEGSPYDHEDFKAGKVVIKDSEPVAAMLRYDVYRDNIEMEENGAAVSLLKRDYITVTIDNEKLAIFSYKLKNDEIKQGYFFQLTDGDLKLLKKKSKRFLPGMETSSTYKAAKPPRFIDEVEYYLVSGTAVAEPVKLRKKTILKAMEDNPEVAKIIKERDLDLSEEADVVELITIVNALPSIK
jgi:hypothetical protein